ncbi:MAG: M24 family metallopeptidase, partial [bacterium]|nr:M24 family metallopeptidase [bacterium]
DRAMVEALGPGVRCSEVYGVGMAAMGAVCAKHPELERFGPARMGHGQGMLITEPPSVNPEDHTVLEPGMVLSTEPGLGCGAVRMLWEDVHVITEDGSEKLTMECEELWEIV